jgi:hypothetical protein
MWSDPEGQEPLRYIFGYKVQGLDDETTWLSPSDRNFFSSRLPSGTTLLFAAVADAQGAVSEPFLTVSPQVLCQYAFACIA